MRQIKSKIISFEHYLLYGLILSIATYAIPCLRIRNEYSMVPIGSLFLPVSFFMLLSRYFKSPVHFNTYLVLSLFFMYLSIPVSSLFSTNIEIERIIKLSIFLFMPVLFAGVINDKKTLEKAFYCLIVVGIILGIYGFYGYITGNIGEDTQKEWWVSYARYWGIHYLPSTRNTDVHYVAIPFFITLALLFYGNIKSLSQKLLLIALCLLFFICILLSFSRGAWIAMIMTIFIFLLVLTRTTVFGNRIKHLLAFSIIFILFIIIGLQVVEYFGMSNYFTGKIVSILSPAKADIKEFSSNKQRIELLGVAFKVIITNPFGVGPGNLVYFFGNYQFWGSHAENNYIQILSENGIFGFVGFLLLVFYPVIIVTRKIKNKLYNWVDIGVILTSTYLIITYLFNVEVYNLYIWIVNSLLWANVNYKIKYMKYMDIKSYC